MKMAPNDQGIRNFLIKLFEFPGFDMHYLDLYRKTMFDGFCYRGNILGVNLISGSSQIKNRVAHRQPGF
jgi:hypothetical protein